MNLSSWVRADRCKSPLSRTQQHASSPSACAFRIGTRPGQNGGPRCAVRTCSQTLILISKRVSRVEIEVSSGHSLGERGGLICIMRLMSESMVSSLLVRPKSTKKNSIFGGEFMDILNGQRRLLHLKLPFGWSD